MATKAALKKAFDAGQAAYVRNLRDDVNPFDPLRNEDEHDEWQEGYNQADAGELQEKFKDARFGLDATHSLQGEDAV